MLIVFPAALVEPTLTSSSGEGDCFEWGGEAIEDLPSLITPETIAINTEEQASDLKTLWQLCARASKGTYAFGVG